MICNQPYRYCKLLVQIFVCLLTLHLARCQGCSNLADKAKPTQQPINQLDEKVVMDITNDFLKAAMKDLQAGQEVDIAKQAPGGDTPLMLAVKEPQNQVKILTYLLGTYKGTKEELNKKINQSNAQREAALTLALKKEYYNPEVIKLLVKHGADPYANNGVGVTPVLTALLDNKLNNLEALQSLLNDEVGYSGVCEPKNGSTPLHIAAIKNNKPISKYLVSKGADKSKTNKDGKQPIFYATDPEMKVLLQP